MVLYICISKPISPLVLRNSTEDTVAEECKIKFIDKEIFQIEGPPGTVKSLEYVLNCFINFVLKQAPCLKQIVAKSLFCIPLLFYLLYMFSGYRHWNWVLKRFYHRMLYSLWKLCSLKIYFSSLNVVLCFRGKCVLKYACWSTNHNNWDSLIGTPYNKVYPRRTRLKEIKSNLFFIYRSV